MSSNPVFFEVFVDENTMNEKKKERFPFIAAKKMFAAHGKSYKK